MKTLLDQVILVDTKDHKIGVLDKVEAHRGVGRLHRAISVFLFNSQGKLLIQQRSAIKIVGALQWANTCCGNVRPSETYEQCALRRLREELGIEQVNISAVTKFLYQVQCNDDFSEYEMDQVFIGRFDGEVIANPLEVKATSWTDWSDFLLQTKSDTTIAPWVKVMFHQGVLEEISNNLSTL